MNSHLACALVSISLCAGACGGAEPVDASGDYTLAVTNRDNGCDFDNWTVGETSSGIPLTVTQEGSEITASVGGGAGLFLNLGLGNNVFLNEVSGDHIDGTLFGTRSQMMAGCSYTVNAVIIAQLEGDILTGELRYRTNTNGSPDCGSLEGCVSRQEFNGTRPPSGP